MTYRCIVSGRVQGVWYRKYVSENARKEGFKGYVRNLPDGTVEAVVTLEDDTKLKKFINILKKGSPYSDVKNIDIKLVEEESFNDFEIRY